MLIIIVQQKLMCSYHSSKISFTPQDGKKRKRKKSANCTVDLDALMMYPSNRYAMILSVIKLHFQNAAH